MSSYICNIKLKLILKYYNHLLRYLIFCKLRSCNRIFISDINLEQVASRKRTKTLISLEYNITPIPSVLRHLFSSVFISKRNSIKQWCFTNKESVSILGDGTMKTNTILELSLTPEKHCNGAYQKLISRHPKTFLALLCN